MRSRIGHRETAPLLASNPPLAADARFNSLGARGIGQIGITGVASALGNDRTARHGQARA